jgi:hypothetical protein
MFLFLTGYLKKTGVREKRNSRNVCSLMNCSVLGFPRQFFENASITIACNRLQANLVLIFSATGRNLRLAERKIHSLKLDLSKHFLFKF